MKKVIKKLYVAFVCTLFVISLNCFGISANAAESTVGTEVPKITAVYTDGSGEKVDGNALTAGTYQMVLSVSDVSYISQMEFTATYDESVLTINSCAVLPDSNEQLFTTDSISRGGKLVFGIISEDSECTALADSCLTLLTMDFTVASDSSVDMADIIIADSNPHFTFFEVSYNDRTASADGKYIYDCYALGTANDFEGTVYSMECDLSPELPKGYNVSAYIGALATPTDENGTYPVTGATVSVTTRDGVEILATTNDSGLFTLESVPSGEYTATVTYPYGFERTFTIVVNDAEISSSVMVGIIACNWDGNSVINIADYNVYNQYKGLYSTDDGYDVGIDIDRLGVINIADYNIYNKFKGLYDTDVIYADTVIS